MPYGTTWCHYYEALQKYEKNPQYLVNKADFNTTLTISSSFGNRPDRF